MVRTRLPKGALVGLLLMLGASGTARAQDLDLATTGADVRWRGVSAGAAAGTYLDHGTMNNDARRDLLIGAPGGAGGTGHVYIIFGGPVPADGEYGLDTAAVTINGAAAGDGFGTAIAAGNILNLDGTNPRNLIVGAPNGSSGAGTVYVFTTGYAVTGTPQTFAATTAAVTIHGAPGDRLGSALATADLDADGYRELIIGAPGTGRVYILWGGPGLAGQSRDMARTDTAGPDVTITGTGIGSVLTAGAFTGDSIYDVFIGAPSVDFVYMIQGSGARTYPRNMLVQRDETAYIVASGQQAGSSLRMGDFDGDNRTDLLIGAPATNADRGAAYIFWGRKPTDPPFTSIGIVDADVVLNGPTAGGRFGQIVTAGDINRDTGEDVAIVAPAASAGGTVYVYYGRSKGTYGVAQPSGKRLVDMNDPSQVSLRVIGDAGAGGITAAQVYEVTGEGARDLIIGAANATTSAGAHSGRVYFALSPKMRLSSTDVYATAVAGAVGQRTISVLNASPTSITYSAQANASWLAASPSSGSAAHDAPGTLNLLYGAGPLSAGDYTGPFTVTSTSPHLMMTLNGQVRLTVITQPTLAVNQTFPANALTPITWTAQSTGGAAGVLYKFYRYDASSGWHLAQDWSSSNTYTWTPGLSDAGDHSIQAWVRTPQSTAAYDAVVAGPMFSVVKPVPTITSFTNNGAFPMAPNTPVQFNATATGGSGPLQYRFYLYREGSGWSILQDYGAANQVTWTPTAVGRYAMQVWVRSSGVSDAYEAARDSGTLIVSTTDPVTVTGLIPDQPFPAKAGKPVTFTATATGGSAGPLQYQFWRYDAGRGWTIAQAFGVSRTYTWTPTAADVGNHAVQVWVRSAGSSAAYEGVRDSGTFEVVTEPFSTPSLSADVVFPVPPNTTVKWTANVSGGIEPLEFQFWLYREGAGWTMIRDYGTSRFFSWTPTLSGTYQLQVWIRNAGSTAAYDTFASTPLFQIKAGTAAQMVTLSADRALPTAVGTTVTWTAVASNGTAGPLQFRFWRYSSQTGAWTIVQDYGASNTFSWTIANADSGQFELQAWVRSAGSTAAYEGWATTGLITVK